MFKNIRSKTKNTGDYHLGVHPHAKPNLMHLPQEELNALAEKQSREIERDNMMLDTIKIKKLHEDAITPTRSHSTDAGLDIYANETITVTRGTLVSTGIAIDIPAGYEGTMRPRSGLTIKTPLRVQLGTVDAGYNGEIKVIADCYPATALQVIGHRVKKGDKIAQLVISPIVTPTVEIVEEFESESARGANGFGSTDR